MSAAVFFFMLAASFSARYLPGMIILMTCFKKRNRFAWRLAVSIAVYFAATFVLFFTEIGKYLIVGNIMLHFLVICAVAVGIFMFCIRMKPLEAVFYSCAAYCMEHCVYSLTVITTLALEISFRSVLWLAFQYAVIAVMYTVFYFLFVKRIKRNGSLRINNGYLTVFSIVTMLIVFLLSSWISFYEGERISVRVYSLICGLFILIIQFGMFERSKLKKQNKIMHKILSMEQERQKITKSNVDYMDIRLHDLKNRLSGILDAERARQSANPMPAIENMFAAYQTRCHTGNDSLDAILTEKNIYCGNAGIQLSYMGDGAFLSFMSAEDVYSLFNNALDNAIDSAEPVTEAEKRYIEMRIHKKNSIVSVHVENYYKHELVFQGGIPMTTKPDKSYHGYGMESIIFIAEKYGGTVSVVAKDNIFNLNIILLEPASVP